MQWAVFYIIFFALVVEVCECHLVRNNTPIQDFITLHCARICTTTNTISDNVNCWPDWFSSLLPPVRKSSSGSLLVFPWSHDFYCTKMECQNSVRTGMGIKLFIIFFR